MNTAAVPSAAPARSLAPREHGAYGQLGLPLLAALGMGRPGVAAALLTLAAAAAFAAHEPLLVALGHRGHRARRQDGSRARRALFWLGGAALLLGGAGLALAPPSARAAALAPLLLSAIVARFIARADERSLLGEIAAASALASAALPVALSAGVTARAAVEALFAFCLAFGAATWSVRSVIEHAKAGSPRARRLLPLFAPALVAALLAARGVISPWTAGATAPLLLLSMALAAWPPPARALRKVGVALTVASLLTAAALIAGARVSG